MSTVTRVWDNDDEQLREGFFDVTAMKKVQLLCPRCKAPLLVLNTMALMVEHDKNAGVYCFARAPICYVSMLALRPDAAPK